MCEDIKISSIPELLIVKLKFTSCKTSFKNYTVGNLMLLDGSYLFTPNFDIKTVTNELVEFCRYDFNKKNITYDSNGIKEGIIIKGNPFINEDGSPKYSSKKIKRYINQGYSTDWKISIKI